MHKEPYEDADVALNDATNTRGCEWEPRPITRSATGFPDGEHIVSMCVWKGTALVATNYNLYAYYDDKLHLVVSSNSEILA
jgi:hypothetical protein